MAGIQAARLEEILEEGGNLAAHLVGILVGEILVACQVGTESLVVDRAETVVLRCRAEEVGNQAVQHAVRAGRHGVAAAVEGA